MNLRPSFVVAFALLMGAGLALAKLPPASDEAKAKSAAAAAKAAHGGKIGRYQLCKVQDKVVADYLARAKKAGTATGAPVAMAACQDPGPFMAAGAAPAAKK